MIQLILVLALLLIAFLALNRLLAAAPGLTARLGRRLGLWALAAALIYLAATGRLGVVVALVGALVAALLRLAPALVQFLPLLQRLWRQHTAGSRQPGSADATATETRYLHMELRHSTGEISGRVLQGRYAGRDLNSLTIAELTALHRECLASDQDAAALLEAYLERIHGSDWQARSRDHTAGDASAASRMTRDEAYEVLGLATGASREAIIQAHRRLMQRMHPDRGGSDYLAAKINRAKDTLLGS